LPKEGSFRVKPLTSMFLCDLGHDAISDRVDDVVSQTLSVFLISSLRFLVRSNQLLVT
jgi:hypothetical protein